MTRILSFFIGIFLLASPAFAVQVPRSSQRDTRIKIATYSPYEVYKIVARYRVSTQLIFDPTEEIIDVAVGNTVAWETAPSGNSLFIKPRERHPITNLQVVTVLQSGARRSYQFELESVDASVRDREAFLVVRFEYPEDVASTAREKENARRAAREGQIVDHSLALHQRYGVKNWAYSAQGERSIQPDAVFDDGKVTTMLFQGNRDIPAIYSVAADGTETLIPKDVRENGEMVVVHSLAKQFILRHGKSVVCIYNEAFDPVGNNPKTGTTSPSIKREVVKGRGRENR